MIYTLRIKRVQFVLAYHTIFILRSSVDSLASFLHLQLMLGYSARLSIYPSPHTIHAPFISTKHTETQIHESQSLAHLLLDSSAACDLPIGGAPAFPQGLGPPIHISMS